MISFDDKAGAYRVTINKTENGRRIRKTKRLPRGCDFETAARLAESMTSEELPLQQQLYRATLNRPDDVGAVYLIKHQHLRGPIKIGMTRRTVHERRSNLSTGHVGKTSIIASALFRHVEIVEAILHQHFSDRRAQTNREYFLVPEAEAIATLNACAAIDGYDLSAVINKIGRKPRQMVSE